MTRAISLALDAQTIRDLFALWGTSIMLQLVRLETPAPPACRTLIAEEPLTQETAQKLCTEEEFASFDFEANVWLAIESNVRRPYELTAATRQHHANLKLFQTLLNGAQTTINRAIIDAENERARERRELLERAQQLEMYASLNGGGLTVEPLATIDMAAVGAIVSIAQTLGISLNYTPED